MTEFYRPVQARGPRGRRRAAWTRLAVGAAGLALVLAAVVGIVATLKWNARFRVKRVVTEGVPEARRDEVEGLTDPWIGAPLLFVDVAGPLAALSARPWVERAGARRVVPDTLVVSVVARPAVALARRGTALWTVDAAGTWLGPLTPAAAATESFVVLDLPAETADPEAVRRGAALVARLAEEDPRLLARASEIAVESKGFRLFDEEAGVLLRLGPDAAEPGRAAAAWRAYLAVAPELARAALPLHEADLRFEGRIVLKASAPDGGRGKT